MIPKIIHYCWFGRGQMTPLMMKCIKSWKKFCPEWQIMEWNEDNFDVNSTIWTKQAYEAKKYAFVADYVRLHALKTYGGVYMDNDQELIKPLDSFLKKDAFLGFMDAQVNTGLIGADADSQFLKKMLNYYNGREFVNGENFDKTPNTEWMTEILISDGLQIKDEYQCIKNVEIYPKTYFCPTTCDSIKHQYSKDTFAIHHWAMTWRSEEAKKKFARARRMQWYAYFRYMPNRILRRLIGDKMIDNLKSKLGNK